MDRIKSTLCTKCIFQILCLSQPIAEKPDEEEILNIPGLQAFTLLKENWLHIGRITFFLPFSVDFVIGVQKKNACEYQSSSFDGMATHFSMQIHNSIQIRHPKRDKIKLIQSRDFNHEDSNQPEKWKFNIPLSFLVHDGGQHGEKHGNGENVYRSRKEGGSVPVVH